MVLESLEKCPWKHNQLIMAKGAFFNYFDQILPNFDPYPLWIDNILHGTYSFFTWPSVDFLLTPYPPNIVYVVIEWPFKVNWLKQKLVDDKVYWQIYIGGPTR